MNRRGFFTACLTAAAAMLMPAAKALDQSDELAKMILKMSPSDNRLICVWRGRVVMMSQPDEMWYMSVVDDPASWD